VPLGKLRALHYPTLLASVLLLLWQARLFVARNGFDLRRLDRIETFAICVVVGILANDIVCGVLSGPYERYQVRVIWLVPMLALATLICAPEKLRRRARG
jgi:peptidoglycan/LPS O-acetylase OafA/YrhL